MFDGERWYKDADTLCWMIRFPGSLFAAALLFAASASLLPAQRPAPVNPVVAATPPMGWNSWDSFGLSVKEPEFRANTEWLNQHLKRYGYQYSVVDEGWYLQNPESAGKPAWTFTLSKDGRYMPAPNRFPSAANGAGFKPLADYVHSLGLKFGIHIIRGIPKEAVAKNLPIADSSYHAADAADRSDTCPWNPDNYGVKDTPAGQAYYDSVAKLYASWGLDFLKVDCIATRPFKEDEIRMISLALRKTGRPIVLSLSPGPTSLANAGVVRKYAQMWRISDDFWDHWGPTTGFDGWSQSLHGQFATAIGWAQHIASGQWPDADMLPLGYLGPRPGLGSARQTRFTHDEQRTLMTLWSIFRSPLIMGGNLTHNDAWTTALLTNSEVLAVDQHSTNNKPLITTDSTVIWSAQSESGKGLYLAIFNRGDKVQKIQYKWNELGLSSDSYKVRDLWEHKDLGAAQSVNISLPPHASVLYRVSE